MTPHKYSTGGSWIIDRIFRGIGRLQMASGITNASTFRAFNDGLTEMAKDTAGRAWIRAMLHGEIAPIDVWTAYKEGRWREAPRPETGGSLVEALEAWREDTFQKKEVAAHTYRVRNELITHVKAIARVGATIEELPHILRQLRARVKGKGARSFNLDRDYARAFCRDTLGKRHPIYLAVVDVPAITIKKSQRRKTHPISPAELLALAAAFSTKKPGGLHGAPGHGHIVIGMALTGMGPEEYWGEWRQLPTHVHIAGTKRDPRVRDVPKLYPSKLWPHLALKRPTITRHSFDRAFRAARKVAKLSCTPYDMRRSFANWMEAAGIERTRRNIYRGHGPKDIGDYYERHEVKDHLENDAATLLAWIERELTRKHQLTLLEGGR